MFTAGLASAATDNIPVYFYGDDGYVYGTVISVAADDVIFCVHGNDQLICYQGVAIDEKNKIVKMQPVITMPVEES